MNIDSARKKIVLQVPRYWTRNLEELKSVVETLKDYVGYFYTGSGFWTEFGPLHLTKLIHNWGGQVFLPLDLDDSVTEISSALQACRRSKVEMVSVSTTIGLEYLEMAMEGTKKLESWEDPNNAFQSSIIANLLPRFMEGSRASSIFGQNDRVMAAKFAGWVEKAGLNGMVFSAAYLDLFKNNGFAALKKIVFDIRPEGQRPNTKKNSIVIAKAAKNGADMFLICHPIIDYASGKISIEAAERIAAEIVSNTPSKKNHHGQNKNRLHGDKASGQVLQNSQNAEISSVA